jgi:NAD-dependent deacetylase
LIQKAAKFIKSAKRVTAFTGAGISAESGIPLFRGEDGLWEKYNPEVIDIEYFKTYPDEAWAAIRKIFYRFCEQARPNSAHRSLSEMEASGYLHSLITLNIDNLHHLAGSREVCEFHGNLRTLICLDCSRKYAYTEIGKDAAVPRCTGCGGLLKPDFVFFREPVPEAVRLKVFYEAQHAEVFLVIGTSGEINPSARIPYMAKENGATIIEINPEITKYTATITDIVLPGTATEMMKKLKTAIFL